MKSLFTTTIALLVSVLLLTSFGAAAAVDPDSWTINNMEHELTGKGMWATTYVTDDSVIVAFPYFTNKCLWETPARTKDANIMVNGTRIGAVTGCYMKGVAYMTAKSAKGNQFLIDAFKSQSVVKLTQGVYEYKYSAKGFTKAYEKKTLELDAL